MINGQIQFIEFENECGISLDGNNPSEKDYFKVDSLDDASNLANRLNNELNQKNIENLLLLIGNNIKELTYITDLDKWKITYKNDLEPNYVDSSILFETLKNI